MQGWRFRLEYCNTHRNVEMLAEEDERDIFHTSIWPTYPQIQDEFVLLAWGPKILDGYACWRGAIARLATP